MEPIVSKAPQNNPRQKLPARKTHIFRINFRAAANFYDSILLTGAT